MFNVKKAQVQGQVLMMILTLAIISFLLIFGGKIIMGVTEQGSMINYVKFKTNLQNDIDAISQEYKTKKEINLVIPDGFVELCFVDFSKVPPEDFQRRYPIIYDYWSDQEYRKGLESNVAKNVFLRTDKAEASFNVGNIQIGGDGYLCIEEKRSKVDFWVEGLGSRAKITKE